MAVMYSRAPERPKHDTNKTSACTRPMVQRLFILIALLSSPTPRSLSDMASFLGVTTRTLKRDLRFLRSLGLEITYKRSEKGFSLDLSASRSSETGQSLLNMSRWIVMRDTNGDN